MDEIIDFLTGLFGCDILGDDLKAAGTEAKAERK
jgi:hypothetical protein